MNGGLKTTGVIFRKEFLDTIRDRRALASMILVPLIVIPLIIVGFGGLSFVVMERAESRQLTVMVLQAEEDPALVETLAGNPNLRVVEADADYADLISSRRVNAAVALPENFRQEVERGKVPRIVIHTYEGELSSSLAAQAVEEVLRGHLREIQRERLAGAGLAPEFLTPFTLARQNVAPPERVGGNLLGGVLPYLLVILCLTGAVYPAMDLTAGEKERGTIETLLTSPAPRSCIVYGKFLVVFCFSILTALLALGTLGASLWAGTTLLRAQADFGELSLAVSPSAVASVFLLLVPVAVLFSALLLAISLFARSYKEAQTYISPLMIVAMLPALVAAMPGVELTPVLALVPVLNVSLVGKEILTGLFPWGAILFVFFSTCLYAAAALWGAVCLFNREDVLFRAS